MINFQYSINPPYLINMQDTYVSLNPDNTATEEKAIRSNMYAQRVREASGGEAAGILGCQFGFTAMILTYSNMSNKGFTLFPY